MFHKAVLWQVWGMMGFFVTTLLEITAKSLSEQILIIGEQIMNSEPKQSGTFFLDMVYMKHIDDYYQRS